MHANKREERDEVFAGDIAAAIGLKEVKTGDTLCIETSPIILEAMKFPEPVIAVAIEPKTKADGDKLTNGLVKLADEDPTFRVHTDPETNQTVSSASSASKRTSVDPRSRIGRRSGSARRRWRASSSARPGAEASTDTWSSTSSRATPVAASSSRTRSSVA